jgi:hypothetical protein
VFWAIRRADKNFWEHIRLAPSILIGCLGYSYRRFCDFLSLIFTAFLFSYRPVLTARFYLFLGSFLSAVLTDWILSAFSILFTAWFLSAFLLLLTAFFYMLFVNRYMPI